MPKSNPYEKGSIVYVDGDYADKIFVLQSGIVDLMAKTIETGETYHEQVQPGKFFGIKSALGGYPREELATALVDSTVMSFTVPEFEAFAKTNPSLLFKMLKVFSGQLREINKRLSTLTKEAQSDPEDGLYGIANFYIKQRRLKNAEYVLKKYIETYPNGKYIDTVKANYVKFTTSGR